MKKLLMAMAVASVAFFAHAAAVNWTIEGIQTTGDFDEGTGDYAAGYLVYLFDNSGAYTRTQMSSLIVAAATGDDTWQTALSSSLASAIADSNGGVVKNGIAVADGNFTGYLVVLDAGTVDAAQYAFVSDTYVVADNSMHKMAFGDFDGDGYVNALDYTTAGQVGSTWTSVVSGEAVPEPTSGLLLLVGGALLALKRRRA